MIDKETILKRLTEATSGTDKELYTDEERDYFASFYVDKWDDGTSEEVIAESFMDFWWNTRKECRRCSVCGKLMRSGYCLHGGEEYYCSEECMHTVFATYMWMLECTEDDQTYWTEWL